MRGITLATPSRGFRLVVRRFEMRITNKVSRKHRVLSYVFIVAFMLLVLGVTMALLGRIDYTYHVGTKQTVGVILREDEPSKFWEIIGPFIVVSGVVTFFAGRAYFRNRRVEFDHV
jgi:hypothetical protein